MKASEKEVAKQIIVEIVRQAGGTLDRKTSLNKAFYHAHLRYADQNPGYLSSWQIVHLPRGPGIHRVDDLLDELRQDGVLELVPILIGTKAAVRFRLLGSSSVPSISPEGIDAIKYGLSKTDGNTTRVLSDESHQRSWHQTMNAQDMNIYIDNESDEEFKSRDTAIKKIASIFNRALEE